VDHQDAGDPEELGLRPVALAQEVDRGALARAERQLLRPETLREQLRDVPVREQQAVADDEPRAAVRERRVVGELDSADRGDGGLDRLARGGVNAMLDREAG
jgi:hypothetical protein